MNYRTLAPDELARMAEYDAGAQAYLIQNAHDLLTGAAEASEAQLAHAYQHGSEDGYDDGWKRARESLLEEFETRIEDELARTLGVHNPDELNKKRRRRWDLLTEILEAMT